MRTNAYINNLFGLSHVFNETNYLATKPGQSSLIVSDGTIAGTIAGGLYFIPYGQAPVLIGGGGGGLQSVDNIGAGTGEIFSDITGSTINLRTLVAGAGISITTVGDEVVITNTGGGNVGYEDIDTSDAIDPDANIEVTSFNCNTGNTVVLTLDDPAPPTPGTKKKLIASQVSAGSKLSLLIPSLINGSSLLFETLGQSASLIFTSVGWAIDVSGCTLVV
jgi:hypothetical protein